MSYVKKIIFLLIFVHFNLSFSSIIIDSFGKKIKVVKSYKRIISLYSSHTDVLIDLGVGKKLIGVDKHHSYLKKDVFLDIDNVEKFLEAKPDLIIVVPIIKMKYNSLFRILEGSGITVLSLQPKGFDCLDEYWETLGILGGKEKEAKLYIKSFHEEIKKIKAISSKVPKEKRKTVFFESRHKNGPFTTSNLGIPWGILEILNVNNIAKDVKPIRKGSTIAKFPIELLLTQGDKIDIYIARYDFMNKINVDIIKKTPGFKGIKAVRDEKIYIIDGNKINKPTNKIIDGIYEIGRGVYPEYFKQE